MELPQQTPPEMQEPEESEVEKAAEALLEAEAVKRNPSLYAAAKALLAQHKQGINSINGDAEIDIGAPAAPPPIASAAPGGAMAALKAVRAAKLAGQQP